MAHFRFSADLESRLSMNPLVKTNSHRAITAYEDVQERTSSGVRTTRRYYSSQPAPKEEIVEIKNSPQKTSQDNKSEGLDTISFMVLANSICLFFLLMLMFVKVLIG